ncbi:MAG: PAS domain-containing protein [Rhodospirillales bacterium]
MMGEPDDDTGPVFGSLVWLDPEDITEPDHRLFLDYWNELRGGKFAPAWSDWDWRRIPGNLIPYCFVVDALDGGTNFKYRFWGTAHADIHGIDYTGKLVTDIIPPELAETSRAQYEQACSVRKPVIYMHELTVGKLQLRRIQTSFRMPLSSDGKTVDMLFSFADWRDIREDMKRFFENVQRDESAG